MGDIMIKCDLKQINRVKHTIPIRIKKHTHKHDELTYFISGNGTTEISGETHPYKAGEFAFYKKGTVHDEFDPEPCDIIWTHIDFDIEGVTLKEGVFDDGDGKLLALLQKLRNLSLEQTNFNKLSVEICLANIIITAAEKQQVVDVVSERLNWEKILNYIDTNINEQVDFAFIAASNNYSYGRFRHLFAERFGISPYAYLVRQRIKHAKRLLKNSDTSITAIAFDCGFNSSSQFTNIFKKHVGITPKEYRKNHITKAR